MTILFSYLNYFSNITFSCSADRPYQIYVVDVHIKQFDKKISKDNRKSDRESLFFQTILHVLPNLNVALH